jgi:small-conductance mechanosensitive channel
MGWSHLRDAVHLFMPVLGLLLAIAGGWLGASICRRVAARLRHAGQRAAPLFFETIAPTLRWVVVLGGLHHALILAWNLWVGGPGPALLFHAIFILTIWVGAVGLSRMSRLVLALALQHMLPRPEGAVTRSQQALGSLLQHLAQVIIWLGALVMVFDHFDRSLASVVAALGVGSLAIGLAAQQALSNMIAGLVLIADRPFRIGDRVRLPGVDIGRVEEMGLRSTHLRLGDGNLLIVPNADLVAARITNYRTEQGHRGEVRLQLPQTTDLDRLRPGLLDEVAADPGVLAEPAPRLLLLGLGEKLDLALSFHLDPEADAPDVEDRLRHLCLRHIQALAATKP